MGFVAINNTMLNTFTVTPSMTTTATMTIGTGTGYRIGPRYWYRIERVECNLCGKVEETRQRMDLPRPEELEDRIHHEFIWGPCKSC